MRAVGLVIGARRDQLDGVGSEDGQIANVLLPHRHGPAIVGIGLRPVAELMAAQGITRGAGFAPAVGNGNRTFFHSQLAQQTANAKQDAARIVSRDSDPGVAGFDVVSLGRSRRLGKYFNSNAVSWGTCDWPADARSLLDLVD